MITVVDDSTDEMQWSQNGYISISGALLDKANELDQLFRNWAADSSATEYRFPSLISMKSLAPIAYLKSFPHLATFVTSGDRRDESLSSIAENFGTAEQIRYPGIAWNRYRNC